MADQPTPAHLAAKFPQPTDDASLLALHDEKFHASEVEHTPGWARTRVTMVALDRVITVLGRIATSLESISNAMNVKDPQ